MSKRLPLVVRLRNFVGDVILSVPTLQRLEAAGYELHLVGKGWAASLLEGHGWSVQPYAHGTLARVRQLRALRRSAQASDPSFNQRVNAITFPFSFSSALEMRMAGLRCLGHVNEQREFLLSRSVKRLKTNHVTEVYWQLGNVLLGQEQPAPAAPQLRVSPAQQERAAQSLRAHGVGPGYVVICPFASSAHGQHARGWPPFAHFVAEQLPKLGRPIVVCPGPGEEAQAQRDFPGAVRLEKLPLGDYAAVLQGAALLIAGDTGPGHLGAAVGAPTVSLLGPTDPARWRVLGPRVSVLRRYPDWPNESEVLQSAQALLLPT